MFWGNELNQMGLLICYFIFVIFQNSYSGSSRDGLCNLMLSENIGKTDCKLEFAQWTVSEI